MDKEKVIQLIKANVVLLQQAKFETSVDGATKIAFVMQENAKALQELSVDATEEVKDA